MSGFAFFFKPPPPCMVPSHRLDTLCVLPQALILNNNRISKPINLSHLKV